MHIEGWYNVRAARSVCLAGLHYLRTHENRELSDVRLLSMSSRACHGGTVGGGGVSVSTHITMPALPVKIRPLVPPVPILDLPCTPSPR